MKRQRCPNKGANEEECPCSEVDCARHGVCCECIAYHKDCGDLPACLKD